MASDAPLTITIRPFVPGDQAAARALILAGLGEHFGWIDATLNPDLDDIAASYAPPAALFLVAERDGAIVGTGALRQVDAAAEMPTGEIVRVSVHQGLRGQGVGRALVERLATVARQRGTHRLLVETNKDWHDAIRLYRHCGFAPYAEDDVSIYLSRDPA